MQWRENWLRLVDSINAPFKVPDKCVPKIRLNTSVVSRTEVPLRKMLSVGADGTVSLSNQGGAGSANSCFGRDNVYLLVNLSCFQLDSTQLYVVAECLTYNVGAWSTAAFSYTIK